MHVVDNLIPQYALYVSFLLDVSYHCRNPSTKLHTTKDVRCMLVKLSNVYTFRALLPGKLTKLCSVIFKIYNTIFHGLVGSSCYLCYYNGMFNPKTGIPMQDHGHTTILIYPTLRVHVGYIYIYIYVIRELLCH